MKLNADGRFIQIGMIYFIQVKKPKQNEEVQIWMSIFARIAVRV